MLLYQKIRTMLNTNLEETKRLIADAAEERTVISFTRIDNSSYNSSQERFVIEIFEDKFFHTSATKPSKTTIETRFDEIHTISVSYESKSSLKPQVRFDYDKLDLMLKKYKKTTVPEQ
jgi:hypothetical protein